MAVINYLVLLSFGLLAVSAFGGNEDKFIKKYAMMKIYESCFGDEIIRQIRKEMKAACAKCAMFEVPIVSPVSAVVSDNNAPQSQFDNNQDPTKQGLVNEASSDNENNVNPPLSFDPEKLHQAILAYRPNPFQPTFRPYPTNSGFYPGYVSPGPLFYPTGFQGSPVPYTPPYHQYPSYYPPGFFGNQRISRAMDMKNHVEALTVRMSGRVRNITCIMQELGYLDDNLEPNYDQISKKIGKLTIPDELKQDIQEGITFCQQFSQCIPEVKKEKSPLSSDLVRPMLFFRCYKHKKLEACVMKDVRERFNGENNLDTFSEPEVHIRSGKKLEEENMDEIESSIYELLYGSDNIELDSIL